MDVVCRCAFVIAAYILKILSLITSTSVKASIQSFDVKNVPVVIVNCIPAKELSLGFWQLIFLLMYLYFYAVYFEIIDKLVNLSKKVRYNCNFLCILTVILKLSKTLSVQFKIPWLRLTVVKFG